MKRSTAIGSGSSNPVKKAFNIGARERLNDEIVRMFYLAGLPFHLARNHYYVSAFTFAANNNIQGYVPPGLLAPIRGPWREKGVSIVSDGWSDSQRRPLINFMAATGGGPMFVKTVDCSGKTKDNYFISNLMKEVILKVRPKNVVQVITDNAQINVENNSVAFEEFNWISEIVGDVMMIKNFICNHSMRLAMCNEFVSLKLLSVAETRFASSIVMLKRVKLIKQGIQTMVTSDKWNCYMNDDIGKAKFVNDKLLDDFWWNQVDYILFFDAPIYDMIRVCDTDRPSLHFVYDMWDTMIEKVKMVIYKHEGKLLEEESTFYNVVHQILVDRYYNDVWLREDPSRVPPHRDEEVCLERKKCLKRFFDDPMERTRANLEYAKFLTKEGPSADIDPLEIDVIWILIIGGLFMVHLHILFNLWL
ncbi:uncharacterized protein LOC114282355 [Camellia sinensis]|uniref:uncharacterized protein LOC114282355 n=1 Tax=Camellia sinensis TaxID=4442 RepID=UPI00103647AD|nr:uncharacterized protein LOC114282355 [Camellia sinensis]